jgi:hypothetical protein
MPPEMIISEARLVVDGSQSIGRGAYGAVFHALLEGRPCVLKVMKAIAGESTSHFSIMISQLMKHPA